MNSQVDRRSFLRGALISSALVLGTKPSDVLLAALPEEKRRFHPVKVSRDRLIRTVVGLRPYRSEGFIVSAEKLGEKLLVHDYGHGGAGVTLSWGTASLAIDLGKDAVNSNNRFAVLGSGVIGLSTARLLQRRGGSVTIYTKALPPETTSNVAGALWLPTSVFAQSRVTPAFLAQFQRASDLSNKAFQALVGPEYGVRWMETYELHSVPLSPDDQLPGGAHLYPERQVNKEARKYFGSDHMRQFTTMLIEPHTYLNALQRDFYLAGGKVVVKELQNRDEIALLTEPVIFNCTGLGSRTLFNDQNLIPVRGQLEVLLPQPEVDYCYLAEGSYMFPRRDGIVLGGSWDHDDWRLEPDSELTNRIIEGNAEVMKRVRK